MVVVVVGVVVERFVKFMFRSVVELKSWLQKSLTLSKIGNNSPDSKFWTFAQLSHICLQSSFAEIRELRNESNESIGHHFFPRPHATL